MTHWTERMVLRCRTFAGRAATINACLVAVILILTACAPNTLPLQPILNPEELIFTPSQAVTVLPGRQFTTTPSPELKRPSPTSTGEPAQTPQAFSALAVYDHLPPTANCRGKLVFLNRQHSEILSIDLDTGEQTILEQTQNKETKIFDMASSPDGQWMAYLFVSSNAPLRIESADGKQKKHIPWKWSTDFKFSLIGWLDNAHLMFLRYVEPGSIPSTVILNSFTDQWNEFKPGELDHLARTLDSNPLIFASANVVPDPSLRLLVYPMEDDAANNYVVLWDSQKKQVIAKLQNFMHFEHDPLWAVGGEDFLIVLRTRPGEEKSRIEDWFRVTQAGRIEPLTHFAETLPYTEILAERRSPDGKRVVFWLKDQFDRLAGRWVIFDLDSPDQYYYLQGTTEEYPYPIIPIWSPDSRYVVVANGNVNEEGPVMIVDTVERWAAKVTENTIPQGWLAGP